MQNATTIYEKIKKIKGKSLISIKYKQSARDYEGWWGKAKYELNRILRYKKNNCRKQKLSDRLKVYFKVYNICVIWTEMWKKKTTEYSTERQEDGQSEREEKKDERKTWSNIHLTGNPEE